MKKYITILILILLIAIPCFAIKNPNPDDLSPYQTVYEYTMALKNKNFRKAYQYITPVFARNLSEDQWVFMMELADKTADWKLLEFKILQVNIVGDIALVIARGTMETAEGEMLMVGNYLLKIKDGKWKIDGKDIRELIPIPEEEDKDE